MYTLNGGNKRAYNLYCKTRRKLERKWYVVDATDVPLGRLSTVVASSFTWLKIKPTFTPNVDTGDLWGKVIHFDFPPDISPEGMLKGLNSMRALIVRSSTARSSAIGSFQVHFTPHSKRLCIVSAVHGLPILSNVSTRDITSMPLISSGWRSHARCRRNAHDFSSFVASGSQTKDHVRTIL